MTRPGRRRRADSRYVEQAGLLAAWLRNRREQAGMSQEQLAAQAQVAVATVRNIEKGVVIEPGYFTVLALMQALGVKGSRPRALRGAPQCGGIGMATGRASTRAPRVPGVGDG